MKKRDGNSDTEPDSICKTYFNLTEECIAKYGQNTIVLLQVGVFFEMYGLFKIDEKTGENKIYFGSLIEKISNITSLNIGDKKYTHDGFQVAFTGFRDYEIDKYLEKITTASCVAVVYVQERDEKNPKKYIRVLHSVHSPGTFLSCETDNQTKPTNNIMCVWFETVQSTLFRKTAKPSVLYGVTSVDIYTGKSTMFEYQTRFEMNPTTFDELERCISTIAPNEIIVIFNSTNSTVQQCQTIIEQYCGAQCQTIHYYCKNDPDLKQIYQTKMENCTKQKYVKEILAAFFSNDIYEKCEEFSTYTIATQSFAFLLNFIQEHNPKLVKKIEMPAFSNTSSRVVLANHTLKQLNIINDKTAGVSVAVSGLSSVSSFLNKCCTAGGKRRFYEQLVNPVFDVEWLNSEYKMIQYLAGDDTYFYVDMFRQQLKNVVDIEKIMRQIVALKIYPKSIAKLVSSLESVKQITVCLEDDAQLNDYLWPESSDFSAMRTLETVIKFVREWLALDLCQVETSMHSFENNIICQSKNPALDELIENHEKQKTLFLAIRNYLNDIMKMQERNGAGDDMDYIKIHETEKRGVSLILTKKRAAILKKYFDGILAKQPEHRLVICGEKIPTNTIKFQPCFASNDELCIPILDAISKELLQFKEKINGEIKKSYLEFLSLFEKTQYSSLENIVQYIAKIDIIQNKTYIARTYNYCMPEIEGNASFVNAHGMRHCLIEHIQQNELYVDNDIYLGSGGVAATDVPLKPAATSPTNGILLFGTNAVGKTSLIRAIGICIIMAQSGMFVPCTQFFYYPYKSIFSRILGNDNLFKGLSTFAVEMSELRVILKMADESSLILGDELCSGTETESALSIFTAGLMELSKKKSHYIFATHFHEIIHFEEIKQLCESPSGRCGGADLALKHMSVIYNRELECLIYERKLKEGAGTRMYGLEVCKYLQLPDDFLEDAYLIRNKYFPDTQGALSFKNAKKYNSDKLRGMCEMCGETMGEEIHHMQEQKNASAVNGYIGGKFHKNHAANLMSLCEKCHLKMHNLEKTDASSNSLLLLKKKSLSNKGYVIMAGEP